VEPLPLPYEAAIENGWRLELTETALRLSKDGEPPHEVPRAKALELIERTWLASQRPFFAVLAPRRRVFRLNEEQAAALNRWLGDDYGPELRHQLKQRLSLAVPMGIFFVLGDPRGVVSWILGGLLVAEGLIHWLRPTYWLFVFEMAFWLGLLLRNGSRVIVALQADNTRGALVSGLLAALVLFLLMMNVRLFLLLRAGIEKRR